MAFRILVARYRVLSEANHRGYARSKYVLAQLEHEFGATALAALSSFRLERWKANRRKDVAPATVNRELTVLKAMLTKAVEWKLLDVNPAAAVKPLPVSNQRLRYLTIAELTALLEAADVDVAAWLAPAIVLAVNLGIRQGEFLRLRWRDLRPEQHLAAIEQTKSNKPRYVPLNATVEAALAGLPRDGETILAWPWGEPVKATTLYAAFRRACTTAGIVDCHWHDLRHTFASHCVMAGVDLATVKDLLGHQSLEMTMRYSHLAPAHKASAVAKLAAALMARPEVVPQTAAAAAASGASETHAALETAPDPARFRHVFSGRQTPAKQKYLENQRDGKWTRSKPIRTAAQIPLHFSMLETSQPFPYQVLAERAQQLRRLGMPNSSIARSLGVTDKTVAKSIRWISAHTGTNRERSKRT
ncbi:MAG: site-specific integrase [Candidatus Binatia bacterium]